MTKIQAIRWFASTILKEKVVIPRERLDSNWGMVVGMNIGHPRLCIPKTLEGKDEGDYQFRKDFVRRYSVANGFANATLTILHECGHWNTRDQINIWEYMKSVRNARQKKNIFF